MPSRYLEIKTYPEYAKHKLSETRPKLSCHTRNALSTKL